MEKSWENFWTTGKVEDYLTYRNRITDEDDKKSEGKEDEREHGTVGSSNGNGAFHHANF